MVTLRGDLHRPRDETATSLHILLRDLPWSGFTQMLASLVITAFFVTSSDSGSLVDDMVTSGGDPDPPKIQRAFWASAEGLCAVCLMVLGGLEAMRNTSITLGLPMSLLIILAAVSMLRVLSRGGRATETQQTYPEGTRRKLPSADRANSAWRG